MSLPVPPLLLITDRHQARGKLEDVVLAAFAGGCRWISLREKDLDAGARLGLLSRLLNLAQPYRATVMVHEDLAAAMAVGADGVHLPAHGDVAEVRARLGPATLLGVSCHDATEIAAAARLGADYVTLSPVFRTSSKPCYGPSLGAERFAEIARGATLPVIALGGIDAERVALLCRGGAAGVAVMGSVMRSPDPGGEIERLIATLPV